MKTILLFLFAAVACDAVSEVVRHEGFILQVDYLPGGVEERSGVMLSVEGDCVLQIYPRLEKWVIGEEKIGKIVRFASESLPESRTIIEKDATFRIWINLFYADIDRSCMIARKDGFTVEDLTLVRALLELIECETGLSDRRLAGALEDVLKAKKKSAEPGATDNPDHRTLKTEKSSSIEPTQPGV